MGKDTILVIMPLTSQQKAFFLLVLFARGRRAGEVFAQVPGGAEMQKLYEPLAERKEKELKAMARVELRKIGSGRVASYLGEIHTDWLADFLSGEPPHLLALLLRQLPADRVAGVLSRLPKVLVDSLPKLSETYAVPKKLADLLQTRFESRFCLRDEDKPKDKHNPVALLASLGAVRISRFFLELGYREIAIGLGGLPEDARQMVLGRLSARDRKNVEAFMAQSRELPAARLKRAQMHLVSREIDPTKPDLFVTSLGSILFAKAVLPADKNDLRMLCMKMSRADSDKLMALIDEGLAKNTDASVIPYREDLLGALRLMLES